jgi:hypothetical protein
VCTVHTQNNNNNDNNNNNNIEFKSLFYSHLPLMVGPCV